MAASPGEKYSEVVMDRVSVVVTAHNVASSVGAALGSVEESLAVFRREWPGAEAEVVIVDDGSTDDTPRIVRRLAAGRPGWKVVHRPQASSPACARNTGARQARGDVLFFLDGDDLFLPEHVTACCRALQEGGTDFVKTGVRLASPVHPDWQERIENSVVINLAVRRFCHEAVGGFPDYHLFRRGEDRLEPEADVFFKVEDMFYNRLLGQLFASGKVAAQTVEYCRHPGNTYDRQYEKFRRPFGQHPNDQAPDERFRMQLGEVIVGDLLPRLARQKAAGRPASIAPLLEAARRHHQAGDSTRAERLCHQALQAEPADADAWRLLGAALQARGEAVGAADAYRRALRLRPDSTDAHYHLGLALDGQGRREEAVAHYRRAVGLRPDHADALTRLGVALAERGERKEAIALFERAIGAEPGSAPAHHNLGVALAQEGRREEAVRCLERALELEPNYAEACFNLGSVLHALGRREEAVAHLRRCLDLRPGHAGACNNLGLALTEAGQLHEAVVVLQQAVRLRPEMKEAHNNLGLAYTDLGRFAEAEAGFREALRLDAGYAEAHSNLGNAYKEQGRLGEALACYQLALGLAPEAVSTRYNRSLALLQRGDYPEGWREYEWRWERPQTPPRPFRQPRWDGSALPGKTVLLWSEQGLGDTLQFVRYAAVVKQRVGRVVFYCPPPLVPLLSSCPGVDQIVAEGEVVTDFDVQVPLMSLPAVCGTTLATVPQEIPYVSADPERVAAWRARLPGEGTFRIGVVWQGNPRHGWDRHRSAPLASLEPLARVADVTLLSLQKGPGREHLEAVRKRFVVWDLGGELDEAGGAFVDTAAVMRSLDLVVTVDTAAAHLAGALGVPVWLALSRVADWRWLRGREDTPWYPSMRLFWQKQLGDWPGVFASMAEVLHPLVAARRGSSRIAVTVVPGELLDRLTILEIKGERLRDPAKRAVVRAELASLRQAWEGRVAPSAELARLAAALRAVNEELWDVEDRLRLYERAGEFGPEFIDAARAVYLGNDRRAELKQQVNALLGAGQGEPKGYADHPRQTVSTACSCGVAADGRV